MVEPRFYEPALKAGDAELRLDGDEGHHLARVLRLGPGDRVRIFDGRGTEVRAEIASVEKSAAVLRLVERVDAVPEARVSITLAQAVLKGEKMDAIVRDATMMGVRAIVPVIAERTVVPAGAIERTSLSARWHRVAVASAKQCGRAVVPDIAPPLRIGALIAHRGDGCRCVLVEPSALDRPPAEPPPAAPDAATVLVGPEGGWTADEVERAITSGWLPWSLGAMTLRAESAPLAALAILRWIWREGV
jgi:16S rRNA (uracil1498-N3)-methyltransferase